MVSCANMLKWEIYVHITPSTPASTTHGETHGVFYAHAYGFT